MSNKTTRSMDWHAVYVRSRAEKKVADRLESKEISVFCPMQTVTRQWSDRKKKVKVPYFRSYVFVSFRQKERLEVLKTPGVVGFVHWLGRPAVIRESEMNEVIAFFDTHTPDKIACQSFVVGQSLEIEKGPLREKRGVVLRQNRGKIVLQIEQLGIVLTAEVSKSHVKPVAE